MGNSKSKPGARNVLVFPYGTEVSYEIVRSLVYNKHFKCILASSDQALIGFHESPKLEFLPRIDSGKFVSELVQLVTKCEIEYIIPAHDDVALILSSVTFPGDCRVVGQSHDVNVIARSKKKTYENLLGIVPVPKTYSFQDISTFPIFVKPDRGQGSKSVALISDQAALEFYMRDREPEDYVVCEYLPGDEFTVDCFSDRGNVLFAGPRTRERTINGISSLSRTVHSGANWESLLTMAGAISRHLSMHGLWFFQAKEDTLGCLRLLEVGPRVSGTMMVNRARGVNFVELALWQAVGKQVSIVPSPGHVVVQRTLEPNYLIDKSYKRLLVDFDDTLLVDGKINLSVMTMVFKAKNEKKPVVLITKHQDRRLTSFLHEYGISAVFDKIIHLDFGDSKARHISEGDLLIDDSFAERQSAEPAGAKCISLDMLEMFIGR